MPARRLRALPETAPRALGLVRVSKEREGMVSPELQRTSISDYTAARGYVLTESDIAPDGYMTGLDESGSRARSAWWPRLDQAVAAVEAGEYDVIVVWKFSRTARHRLRWAVAIDRVESAGGRLESATEQVDTTTSTGRFTRGMLGELNAFEAERIGEVWKESQARRVSTGRPHTGKPRFGYVYDRDTKNYSPDPEQGPVLADLYRRYVAGESVGMLVRWLNRHGWRTTRGNQWNDLGLRKLLDSGFAAGMFTYHGELHEGAHEPLIDLELWQAYLDARRARSTTPSRTKGSPYVLSGLVRCARCGAMMRAYREHERQMRDLRRGKSYPRRGERLSWRCGRCPEIGAGPGGYIASWKVEAVVAEHLRAVAAPVDEAAATKALRDARRARVVSDVDRLAREAANLEEAMVRLEVANAEKPMPPAVYARSRRELAERAEAVSEALESASAESRRVPDGSRERALQLLGEWDELPVSVRRETLRSLIDCVLVRTGTDPYLRLVTWEEARG